MIKLRHIITEIKGEKIALFPGGFKPFHAGHFSLVMSIPVDKVILFVSAKEKHGLNYDDSIAIITLYNEVFPEFDRKVEISDYSLKYPSPVTAMYELLRSGKLAGNILVLAKSDKDIEDKRFLLYKKYADEGNVKIEVYNFIASIEQNDTIGSTKIMELVDAGKVNDAMKFFPKKLVASKSKQLISILTHADKSQITEGGNVFDDVVSIKREYIEPTMQVFSKELSRIFPNFKPEFSRLGSVGKKDVSGDIDLGVSSKLFFDEDGKPRLKEWGFDPKEYAALVDKFTKRARTSKPEQIALRTMLTLMGRKINDKSLLILTDDKSSSTGMLFSRFPQFDESGKKLPTFIQIDMMIGDTDWLNFAYYSDVYKNNVKGLHRTQLLVALFANKGYVFSHNTGVKNKDTQEVVATTPDVAVALLNKLYHTKLDKKIISNYFTLIEYLKKTLKKPDYDALLDTYLKILESTRADIPEDLQDEWLKRKDRLGLTGKFLPDDSKLKQFITESGVVGGDRIPAKILDRVVDDYYKKVLSKYDKYISHTITGSAKAGKTDYGDIDLILTVTGEDKKEAKKDFAKFLNTLPDDVIAKFRGKYAGRKTYISGELVSTAFYDNGKIYQVDNNISFGEDETKYKGNFLDIPAEKQGLLSGLVRVSTVEENYEDIFRRLGIKLPQLKLQNERYEFVLSGTKLSLRQVKLTPDFKELERKEIWSSTKWSDVEKLLMKYDINAEFLELLDEAAKNLSPTSKIRVKGLFNSLVTVKSGEKGTAKGEHKEKMKHLVDTKL